MADNHYESTLVRCNDRLTSMTDKLHRHMAGKSEMLTQAAGLIRCRSASILYGKSDIENILDNKIEVIRKQNKEILRREKSNQLVAEYKGRYLGLVRRIVNDKADLLYRCNSHNKINNRYNQMNLERKNSMIKVNTNLFEIEKSKNPYFLNPQVHSLSQIMPSKDIIVDLIESKTDLKNTLPKTEIKPKKLALNLKDIVTTKLHRKKKATLPNKAAKIFTKNIKPMTSQQIRAPTIDTITQFNTDRRVPWPSTFGKIADIKTHSASTSEIKINSNKAASNRSTNLMTFGGKRKQSNN